MKSRFCASGSVLVAGGWIRNNPLPMANPMASPATTMPVATARNASDCSRHHCSQCQLPIPRWHGLSNRSLAGFPHYTPSKSIRHRWCLDRAPQSGDTLQLRQRLAARRAGRQMELEFLSRTWLKLSVEVAIQLFSNFGATHGDGSFLFVKRSRGGKPPRY